SLTSAIPSAGREGVPAKITSAMWPPRSARAPCSPSAQLIASTRLDLPEPFGPTITETPGVNSRTVFSANDLKPRIVIDRRNILPRYRLPARTPIGRDANSDVIQGSGTGTRN